MQRTLRAYVADAEKNRAPGSLLAKIRGPAWKKAKEEREELLRFAACAGARPWHMKELALIADFATAGELRRLGKQIRKGGMGDVFPLENVVRRRGGSAVAASTFLGRDMIRRCVKENGKTDMRGKEAYDSYLCWAAEHGAEGLRPFALAGLISLCACEYREKSAFGKTHFLATDNKVKAVKRLAGGRAGEEAILGRWRGLVIGNASIAAMWGALGGMGASAMEFVGGAQRGVHDRGAIIAFAACSFVAAVTFALSNAIDFTSLEKKAAGLLKRAGSGQL